MFIAIIPMRCGSKGIKHKNIKLIKGKPLYYYSLKQCLKSKIFNKIIISTDSKKYIRSIQKKFKSNIIFYHLRSFKNSTDSASTESVIYEIVKNEKFKKEDNCFLVQCTSPLVSHTDMINGKKKFISNKFDSLFSSFEKKIFIWQKKRLVKPINYNVYSRPRRQNFKSLIFENGAFYIFNLSKFQKYKNRLFGKIGYYSMPEERSIEVDDYKDISLLKKII